MFGELTRGDNGTTAASSSSGATITFVGLVLIDSELIQYTGKSSNTIDAGVVRGARGTTAASHADGAVVKEANDFVGWGQSSATAASTGSNIRLWSQDNWGEDLIFNVYDGTPYYWDKTLGLANRATTFASQTGASGAPTITRRIMVSGTDRHVICFGSNPLDETDQDLLMVCESLKSALLKACGHDHPLQMIVKELVNKSESEIFTTTWQNLYKD